MPTTYVLLQEWNQFAPISDTQMFSQVHKICVWIWEVFRMAASFQLRFKCDFKNRKRSTHLSDSAERGLCYRTETDRWWVVNVFGVTRSWCRYKWHWFVSTPSRVNVNIKLKGRKMANSFFCENRKKTPFSSTIRAGRKCFCYEIVKVISSREAELYGPKREISN